MDDKLPWHGNLLAVQPRIRLFRSFDEVSHGYLGFALRVQGKIGLADTEFLVGIGKAAQVKHGFRVGTRSAASRSRSPTSAWSQWLSTRPAR